MSASAQGEIELTIKMSESAMNAQILGAMESRAKASTQRVSDYEKQVMAQLALERKRFIAEGSEIEEKAVDRIITKLQRANEYRRVGFSPEKAGRMASEDAKYDQRIDEMRAKAQLEKDTQESISSLAKQREREQAQLWQSQASLNAQKLKELEITRRIAAEEALIGTEVVQRNLLSHEMDAKSAALARLSYQVGNNGSSRSGGGAYVKGGARRFGGGSSGAWQLGQLSQQFQDVAIQAQMGTRATVILAQQGSQIASIFGARGAILGGAIAMGAVFAESVGKVERMKAEFGGVAEAIGSIRGKGLAEIGTVMDGISKAAIEIRSTMAGAASYGNAFMSQPFGFFTNDTAEDQIKERQRQLELLRQSGISTAEQSLRLQKDAIAIAELRTRGMDKEADALDRELKLQRDIANAISNQYLNTKAKKEEAKANLEAMAAAEEKARERAINKEAKSLDAQNAEMERRLADRGKKSELQLLKEKEASLEKEVFAGTLGGNEYRKKYGELLELRNRIMDMETSAQKEIEDNISRASKMRAEALAKELSGAQELKKLTAEYWELEKKIAALKADPKRRSELLVEQAEVVAKAQAAKRQAENEKERADNEKKRADKDNAAKAKDDAEARLKRAIAPGQETLKIAEQMASGEYSAGGRAAARAQKRAEDSLIRRAAREKAKQDFGKDWQKLDEKQREQATRLRVGQVNKAREADKLMAAINPDDIAALVKAIDALLAK